MMFYACPVPKKARRTLVAHHPGEEDRRDVLVKCPEIVVTAVATEESRNVELYIEGK